MKYREQEPPNAVQIELVEGCNLRCVMCGLNGIRGKDNDYKMMSPKTLRNLIIQIANAGWNPRIEFAMHGEPSMHEDPAAMIKIVRDVAPKYHIMMTSNGGGFLRKPGPAENVLRLFEAGLNVLALDDYENARLVPKIRTAIDDMLTKGGALHDRWVATGARRYEYPAEQDGNPHGRRKPSERVLTFIQDIGVATRGNHSHINNHAGAGSPPNERGHGKRCAKPFREMSVRWDGSVAVCCNDWRGEYKCGRIGDDSLDEIWNGKAMGAARVKLYHGQRDFGPCAKCDAISHRVGLLPDKFGKVELQKPDKTVSADIARALSGPPLTAPVLRPWELGDKK